MKKRALQFVIAALLLCTVAFAGVPEDLRSNTVVVTNGDGWGSGVLFARGDRTFIWTAAHVADIFMRNDGSFENAIVIQGDKEMTARFLRAGDCLVDTDCALLEILPNAVNIPQTTIDLEFRTNEMKFYRAFNHINLGMEIIHCGTPYNTNWNERLVTFGRISGVDKELDGYPLEKARRFDHIDITGGPGCSGGPVVEEEGGGILGLLVMGTGPSIMIIEPTRHIFEWAKDHDCLWAFDRSVAMPDTLYPWPGDAHIRRSKTGNNQKDSEWGDPVDVLTEDAKREEEEMCPCA